VLAPAVRLGAYQASKFAVMGFGETLREELADEGIGVTLLFPGGMITRHLESSAEARPADLEPSSEDPGDLTAMLGHRPMTHGSHRPVYELRRDAMEAAFDRMEAP
jgi:short-subunit dehydrogenase